MLYRLLELLKLYFWANCRTVNSTAHCVCLRRNMRVGTMCAKGAQILTLSAACPVLAAHSWLFVPQFVPKQDEVSGTCSTQERKIVLRDLSVHRSQSPPPPPPNSAAAYKTSINGQVSPVPKHLYINTYRREMEIKLHTNLISEVDERRWMVSFTLRSFITKDAVPGTLC
jgi:hypothetical protein